MRALAAASLVETMPMVMMVLPMVLPMALTPVLGGDVELVGGDHAIVVDVQAIELPGGVLHPVFTGHPVGGAAMGLEEAGVEVRDAGLALFLGQATVVAPIAVIALAVTMMPPPTVRVGGRRRRDRSWRGGRRRRLVDLGVEGGDGQQGRAEGQGAHHQEETG